MMYLNKFIFHPGGENDGIAADNSSPEKDSNELNPIGEEVHKEHKTIIEKIKDALHDWSNKDDLDTRIDDTRV